jgi:hypothetical protein
MSLLHLLLLALLALQLHAFPRVIQKGEEAHVKGWGVLSWGVPLPLPSAAPAAAQARGGGGWSTARQPGHAPEARGTASRCVPSEPPLP